MGQPFFGQVVGSHRLTAFASDLGLHARRPLFSERPGDDADEDGEGSERLGSLVITPTLRSLRPPDGAEPRAGSTFPV